MITHPAICVNLPVKDLKKSMEFFRKMGYSLEEADENSARVVIAPNIRARLMVHAKFKAIAPNPPADATKSTEAVLSLRCADKPEVDKVIAQAVAAGGKVFGKAQDYGYMYWHAYQDPDGHVWELLWQPKL